MLERKRLPWLPRLGGFKTDRLIEIEVPLEHVDPVAALWLVCTNEQRTTAELQRLCAKDLEGAVQYQPHGDCWRWLGEGEDGEPYPFDAPPPNALFTKQGVVEGWLFGIHEQAERFGEAASMIYEALMTGELRSIERPPAPDGTPFVPSRELAPSVFADLTRLDWTRALLFVPRGLPERHWASDQFEVLANNLRFRLADVRKLAISFRRRHGKFSASLSTDAKTKRRRELALAVLANARTATKPLTKAGVRAEIDALLRRENLRGLSTAEFKDVWRVAAPPELRRAGRRRKRE